MHENSLEAYYGGVYSGRFSEKRFEMLKFITENPNLTRQEISEQSGSPINATCGRVFELLDNKLITEIKATPRSRLISNYKPVLKQGKLL